MISRLSWFTILGLVSFLATGAPRLIADDPAPKKPEAEAASESEERPPSGASKTKAEKAKSAKASKPSEEDPKKPDEKDGEAQKPGAEEPATLRVSKEPFTVKRKLPGVVESRKEVPVSMNLKRWSDLTVVRAVDHGSEVGKGDTLIEFETDKLREKIRELKEAQPLKELELSAAVRELETLEKTTPISLETASRSRMQAEEDLAHFEDVDRPMRERAAEENVKSVENSLAYALEELNQLKKMYRNEDLVEETEEIILRRAQNRVNELEWLLEQTRTRSERTLTVLLPREHLDLQTSVERRRIDWRAGERSLREALDKKRRETEAKRRETEEAARALREHEEDLAALKVVAPVDGVVYYGMSQRGKWITASMVDKKLLPGAKLSMREVAMTVVDPSALQLRLTVAEDKLEGLAAGQDATVSLKWNADETVSGKLQSVRLVPYHDATFDAVVSLGKSPVPIYPGMNAEAEITLHHNAEALVVPVAAVEEQDGKATVILKGGEKREVELGRRDNGQVELLKGLKEGDEIRAVAPKASPQEAKKEDAAGEGAKDGAKDGEKKD